MNIKRTLTAVFTLLLLATVSNNFARRGHSRHRGGHHGGHHRGYRRGGFGIGFGLGTGFGLFGGPYYGRRPYYRYNYYPRYDYNRGYRHEQLQKEFNELVDKYNNLLDYTKQTEDRADSLGIQFLHKSERFNYRDKEYFERGGGILRRALRQLADQYNDLIKYTRELEDIIRNNSQ